MLQEFLERLLLVALFTAKTGGIKIRDTLGKVVVMVVGVEVGGAVRNVRRM